MSLVRIWGLYIFLIFQSFSFIPSFFFLFSRLWYTSIFVQTSSLLLHTLVLGMFYLLFQIALLLPFGSIILFVFWNTWNVLTLMSQIYIYLYTYLHKYLKKYIFSFWKTQKNNLEFPAHSRWVSLCLCLPMDMLLSTTNSIPSATFAAEWLSVAFPSLTFFPFFNLVCSSCCKLKFRGISLSLPLYPLLLLNGLMKFWCFMCFFDYFPFQLRVAASLPGTFSS